MSTMTDVTIIGAGPYGLSLAAHLRQHGINFRIFGKPMESWTTNMPAGMLLKSAGFASNLYDAGNTFPLRRFCQENDIPYRDIDFPIPLDTFCTYALAFQERFVPDVEQDYVSAVEPCPHGFEITVEGGGSFVTRRVVLAIGLSHFRHVPDHLGHVRAPYLSHSAELGNLDAFKGKEVLVLGSGSSATDIAILLHEKFANVRLIARQAKLNFGEPWDNAALPRLQRLLNPVSSIGPGLQSRLWTDAPWVYRYFSDAFRVRKARTFLGPSGGWFMKERAQSLPVLLGCIVKEARVADGRVHAMLMHADGDTSEAQADHIIAATGFRADVARIPFLSGPILDRLDLIGRAPRLSSHFESSVSGLYFVGTMSAPSFGPVMRFMAGAQFASRKLSLHLARTKERRRGWNVAGTRHAHFPLRH